MRGTLLAARKQQCYVAARTRFVGFARRGPICMIARGGRVSRFIPYLCGGRARSAVRDGGARARDGGASSTGSLRIHADVGGAGQGPNIDVEVRTENRFDD